MFFRILFGLLFGLLFLALPPTSAHAADEDPRLASARQMFEQFMTYNKVYDPNLLKLYAPEAQVCSWHVAPDGKSSKLCMPSAGYKAMLMQFLPGAQAKGEINTFTNVSYVLYRKTDVVVKATRTTSVKNTVSDMEFLLGPDAMGRWMIKQENSVTKD